MIMMMDSNDIDIRKYQYYWQYRYQCITL